MSTPLQSVCGQLQRNLQQHLLLARRLLRLSEEQNRALVASDVVAITRLEGEQRVVLQQQEALEPEREQATLALAKILGLASHATLSEFIPHLPTQEQRLFGQIRRELLKAQEELKRIKEQNLSLLQNALDFVQFSMESITRTLFKPNRYGTNLVALAAPALLLDSRA